MTYKLENTRFHDFYIDNKLHTIIHFIRVIRQTFWYIYLRFLICIRMCVFVLNIAVFHWEKYSFKVYIL